MTIQNHLLSIGLGTAVTSTVIAETVAPDTKEKIIALVSSVLVQSIILVFVELRKLISKRKARKETVHPPLTKI